MRKTTVALISFSIVTLLSGCASSLSSKMNLQSNQNLSGKFLEHLDIDSVAVLFNAENNKIVIDSLLRYDELEKKQEVKPEDNNKKIPKKEMSATPLLGCLKILRGRKYETCNYHSYGESFFYKDSLKIGNPVFMPLIIPITIIAGAIDVLEGQRNTSQLKKAKDSFIEKNIDNEAVAIVGKYLDSKLGAEYINLYRYKDDFDSYIRASKLTKEKNDLKKAYELASTTPQHIEAEKQLVNSLNPNTLFEIKIIEEKDSGLRKMSESTILYGFKGSSKDVKRVLKVKLKDGANVKLKYGSYKVDVKSNAEFIYSNKLNSDGNGYPKEEKTLSYNLTPENNYQSIQELVFENIAVHGKYRVLGSGLVRFLASFSGKSVSEDALDLPISLKEIKLKNEIVKVL